MNKLEQTYGRDLHPVFTDLFAPDKSKFFMHDAASYIVIRTDFCEPLNEDYFYSLSFDSVTCPVTRPGTYGIHIGCWNIDFAGFIVVKSIYLYDFAGKQYPISMLSDQLPPGAYFIRVVTDRGATTTKILKQ